MSDIRAENHGSLWLLRPVSTAGQSWLEEHVDADAITWGSAVVVEPRYVDAIIAGARQDGLEVR